MQKLAKTSQIFTAIYDTLKTKRPYHKCRIQTAYEAVRYSTF